MGASVATGAFVTELRANGYGGQLVVVDPDGDSPYDRPPLSKEFIASGERCPPAPWWDARCEFIRGWASALDVARSRVAVVRAADGATVHVVGDHIVIATGSAPIRLPHEPKGVRHLRSAGDARAIRELASARRGFVILGAGTIGTELASTLRARDCSVDLIDFAARPLQRFLGGHLGDEAASWITEGGVALHLGTRVEAIEKRRLSWAITTDAAELTGDVVISAVGTRPATGWLESTGLDIQEGVRCDAHGTAIDASGVVIESVHAVGDVSRWALIGGEHRRFENWTTAGRQGTHLARYMLGLETHPVDAEPAYFWSRQFGRHIQVLGTPEADSVLAQHIEDRDRRAAFYTLTREGETRAWISINRPREFAMALRDSLRATA